MLHVPDRHVVFIFALKSDALGREFCEISFVRNEHQTGPEPHFDRIISIALIKSSVIIQWVINRRMRNY